MKGNKEKIKNKDIVIIFKKLKGIFIIHTFKQRNTFSDVLFHEYIPPHYTLKFLRTDLLYKGNVALFVIRNLLCLYVL